MAKRAVMNRAARDGETRRRLLDAAGAAFAEKGFARVTVREICRRAKANVAAVNYYFRDKQELYQCVFDEACCVAQAHFDPGPLMERGTPARERLHGFIRQYLHRILSPGRPAWQGKLMAREMMEPTVVLDRVVEAAIRPTSQVLGGLVTEITGLPTGHPQQWFATASVIAQCLFYMHARPVITRLRPGLAYDEAMIEEVAAHVTAFSWAALQGLAMKPETGSKIGRKRVSS